MASLMSCINATTISISGAPHRPLDGLLTFTITSFSTQKTDASHQTHPHRTYA